MISLSWDEMSDIRHALRTAKFRLAKHGFDKDACILHEHLDNLNIIVGKHENDPDDKEIK